MYGRFAEFYDRLTVDIEYDKWADYLESAFLKFGVKPGSILDLACGTGSLTLELFKRGYEMTGLDLSCDMLSVAWEKSRREGADILFVNQDMRKFELCGAVDAVICMLDSINYVTGPKDLIRVFKCVRKCLNPGGLFIFDINSSHKLAEVLPGSVYYQLDEDISWIWHNTYDEEKKLCTLDLTFFARRDDGLYERFDEVHAERAYSHEEIIDALSLAGLVPAGCFGAFGFEPPAPDEQRIFYVARKE